MENKLNHSQSTKTHYTLKIRFGFQQLNVLKVTPLPLEKFGIQIQFFIPLRYEIQASIQLENDRKKFNFGETTIFNRYCFS